MYKIAVFGFYNPDQARIAPPGEDAQLSPVDTGSFMRAVWHLEPAESRVGGAEDAPCFVKLTGIASQPVYVQSLSNRMAPGAALLNCEGYVAIVDAVKILAPRAIQSALQRLDTLHPDAHVIVAAGRQNEPEALSSDELREMLGLHPELPVYPYVPSEPKTAHRLIRRLARYIDDPNRAPAPIFAGATRRPPAAAAQPVAQAPEPAAIQALPRVHGLSHVAITTGNLERALDFYRGLLGFRMIGQFTWAEADATVTHLDSGRVMLELVAPRETIAPPLLPADGPAHAGLHHITLRVTDLDAIVDQLACAEVPLLRDPAPLMDGVRAALVADPDGTPVMLLEGDFTYSRR